MKIAVIGRGLIGAAAAKHLAEQGHRVWLIGQGEPADYSAHNGPFASHYDEGRITRSLDPFLFWGSAAQASIARYRDIEQRSGIPFFNEVGLMMAGPEGSGPITSVDRLSTDLDIECERLTGGELKGRFPYFSFDHKTLGLFEPKNAGHISPRALVRAQTKLAKQAGAEILDTTVTGLKERDWAVRVETALGDVEAHRVLLATGGMSRDLVEPPLPLTVYARTAALFEISEEQAMQLARMPSLIYLLPTGEDPYLLPPIRYPDGKFYVKLGGDPEDVVLPNEAATREWFKSDGSTQVGEYLETLIRARMPDLQILSRRTVPCVTTYTPDNIPLLNAATSLIYTAVGGCGRAAKSSDEIGRLAVDLLLGKTLPDWACTPAC